MFFFINSFLITHNHWFFHLHHSWRQAYFMITSYALSFNLYFHYRHRNQSSNLRKFVLQCFSMTAYVFSLQALKSIIPSTQPCFATFSMTSYVFFFAGIEINHPIYATLFCNLLVSFSVTNVIIGLLPILSFKWWTR